VQGDVPPAPERICINARPDNSADSGDAPVAPWQAGGGGRRRAGIIVSQWVGGDLGNAKGS